MLAAAALAPMVSQRMVTANTVACTQKKQNLLALTGLIENGSVTPVIDRRYPFGEIPAAIRYQEEGHAHGKVVITV